jgi:hypothetical protein
VDGERHALRVAHERVARAPPPEDRLIGCAAERDDAAPGLGELSTRTNGSQPDADSSGTTSATRSPSASTTAPPSPTVTSQPNVAA